MRQLLLLRHAEAEAVRSGSTDFDRALTARGRSDAREAARSLQALSSLPDALLVSPALRARETAAIVTEQLGLRCESRYEPALYQADADALLRALRTSSPAAQTLLLVAHNPGLSSLVRALAGRDLPGDPASSDLRTAGLCHMQVDASSWGELDPTVIRSVRLA